MAKKNVKTNAQAETIVNEVIKEDANMVENKNTETKAIETPATTEAPAAPEFPKQVILFTASRGKNTQLNWYNITVNEDDEMVKIKGCAAELPIQVAEAVGSDKFIAHVDKTTIERCVAENKAVRGTASTFSDVYNRYTKVEDVKGDKTEIVLGIFKGILDAIEAGINDLGWTRPEPEKEEKAEAPKEKVGGIKKAPAVEEIEDEGDDSEYDVIDPFEVEEE